MNALLKIFLNVSLLASFLLRAVLWWQSAVHHWLVSEPDALVQLHNTPREKQQKQQKHSFMFI